MFEFEFGIVTFDIHFYLTKQTWEVKRCCKLISVSDWLRRDLFVLCHPLHSPVVGPSGTPCVFASPPRVSHPSARVPVTGMEGAFDDRGKPFSSRRPRLSVKVLDRRGCLLLKPVSNYRVSNSKTFLRAGLHGIWFFKTKRKFVYSINHNFINVTHSAFHEINTVTRLDWCAKSAHRSAFYPPFRTLFLHWSFRILPPSFRISAFYQHPMWMAEVKQTLCWCVMLCY